MSEPKFTLLLFVQPGNSGAALACLYKALEHHSYTDYQLTIINANEEPELMRRMGIEKPPALVLRVKDGIDRVISSDFHDIDALRSVFGFKTKRW